ncbi:MAG: hypothetical protein WA814_03705 [Candidatus Baltobacteraceae bacterium]
MLPPASSRAVPSWWMLAAVLAYGPLLLFLDDQTRAAWPGQYLLGLLTLGVLWLCSRSLAGRDRNVVWVCVIVATGFEVMGSLVWGGYHYRFGGIPLFVPFGHGLIYVFGLGLAATDLIRRHERAFAVAILGVAVLWTIGGLTVLPSLTGRVDVHGLLWLPLFSYVLLFSPRRAFFAALFIATTDIELFGTWFHSWMWAANTPWVHVTSGNPPSAIAGGYAIIDGSVLLLATLLRRVQTGAPAFLIAKRAGWRELQPGSFEVCAVGATEPLR